MRKSNMFSKRAWLALALLLLRTIVAQQIKIGVVEQNPLRAQLLAAAAEAALEVAAEKAQAAAAVAELQDESLAPGDVSVLTAPVEPDEPLALPAHVCAQAAEGASAVVTGGTGGTVELAGAAAGRSGLPLLLVDPAPAAAPADRFWEALAFHPHPDVLAQVCAALCEAKGWRRAVLLHAAAPRGAALIAPEDEPLSLVARRLPPPRDSALLRNLLLVLKRSGATNFIVWCDTECAVRVLAAAQRVGLVSERYSYIVLALDLHTQPLDEFSHGGANITGLRLFDPESAEVRRATDAWHAAYSRRLDAASTVSTADAEEAWRVAAAPPTALLLAYDAVGLAVEALRRLGLATDAADAAGDCEHGLGALHADTLLNYLRSEEWSGACGGTSWEVDGGRRDVRLHVVELQRGGGLREAGVWAPRGGLTWRRHDPPARPPPRDAMTNRTFTILIAENKPYVMKQESTDRLAGNARYEGFCIELIERLSQLLNFNYTFVEQPGGKYGTLNKDSGKWDGMMGKLMTDPNIDFAITDLTITAEREQAVDFTTPFMNLGISILFRTPKEPEPETFAFLLPFSNGVWLCLGLSYVGTSLLLYVVGRLCPEEWQNPYPCVEEPPALENQFTLANAFWFNLGAVLLQGSEIAPVAYGTRAVASVWWLFALVITSSYTANLATLLAKKTSTELIHNVQELADNELGITYGAKAGGSTYTFFEHSQSPLYQKMFEHMKNHEMPKDNEEGIQKVVNDSFAFLMESTTIEYTIERNCEVTQVGGLLDNKGYGIAMKKNSTYRQALNLALLNLQEAGVLREMKHKWWKEKHGGGACKEVEERESEELAMRNFLGLFLVLVVGCAMGIVVSCCDLAWASWRRSREPNVDVPFSRRFWTEMRFVFRFDRSVKPLHGSLLPSPEATPRPDSRRDDEVQEEEEATEAEAEAEGRARMRSASLRSARARRRSSMHAASVRLARHAARNSSTR